MMQNTMKANQKDPKYQIDLTVKNFQINIEWVQFKNIIQLLEIGNDFSSF